jgi:hypothetical protein
LAVVAAALLCLAAPAAAKGLTDAEGDGGPADLVEVAAMLGNGTATVQALFAGGPAPGTALRGVFLVGEPGTAEPAEWYQFTMANGTQVFAAHGTPHDVRVVSSSWNGSVASLEFERSGPASGSCVFAVVEAGTFGPGGFTVLDVAPRGFSSLDSAWPVTACPEVEADDHALEEKGSPGLGPWMLVPLLGVLASCRRR